MSLNRRDLIKSSLFTSGAAAAAVVLAAMPRGASADSAGDVAILQTALALERQAIAAYQVGAESGLLKGPVLDVAVKFQSHHKAHASLMAATIEKLGGKVPAEPAVASYAFPVEQLKSANDVLAFAAGLEEGAGRAYLGAVPQFANRDLARAAASILGDETMHWAVLLSALGKDPVPAAFIG